MTLIGTVQGRAMAARQAALRKRREPGAFGGPVVAGTAAAYYDCTSKSLDADRRGDVIPEGAGNAASIDQRLISLSPADFTDGSGNLAPPPEDSQWLYQGGLYTIKKVLACEMAYGTLISLPVIIFRSPQAGVATAETPAEATAQAAPIQSGKRKEY